MIKNNHLLVSHLLLLPCELFIALCHQGHATADVFVTSLNKKRKN